MSDALPLTYLARHGETARTISRQHTGRTDLPLTEQGDAEARELGARLDGEIRAQISVIRSVLSQEGSI